MELTLQSTFIELLPPINGGAVVSMALTIESKFSYEALYWIHPNGNKQITIDESFLKLFGCNETEQLPTLVFQAVEHEMNAALPSQEEIFSYYTYGKEDI